MLPTHTAQSSAGRPGTAAQSVHPAGAQPVPMQALAAAPAEQGPADAGDEPRGSRARLTAELAMQRHVTLELQRAILPLHDEPFDLPGLRAVVRYLPASRAGRGGGDWDITADMRRRHA